MNTALRTLMVLALSAAGASASEPSKCQSTLTIAEVAAAMGAGVAIQPVFSGGGLKGWRIYDTGSSAQLTQQGIDPGALMTHVCGVPAAEIFSKGGEVCCSVDTSREVEVTIRSADLDGKILIKRP